MDKLKSGAAVIGLTLGKEQLLAFEIYQHELLEWNRKFNLTAITSDEDIQVKHFLDSLTGVLAYNFDNAWAGVIDVGTGAGFPGLPLKIAFPEMRLTLLEATAKKVTFLQNIVQKLDLHNVEIINGRAEDVAHTTRYRRHYDVVLCRAVASLPTLIEFTLPFCTLNGVLIAYKKGDIRDEITQSSRVIDLMGGRLKEIVPVNPGLFEDERCLVVVEKIKPTPEEYPRRPGMPEKKPLLPL